MDSTATTLDIFTDVLEQDFSTSLKILLKKERAVFESRKFSNLEEAVTAVSVICFSTNSNCCIPFDIKEYQLGSKSSRRVLLEDYETYHFSENCCHYKSETGFLLFTWNVEEKIATIELRCSEGCCSEVSGLSYYKNLLSSSGWQEITNIIEMREAS